jgi:hypothetical protein
MLTNYFSNPKERARLMFQLFDTNGDGACVAACRMGRMRAWRVRMLLGIAPRWKDHAFCLSADLLHHGGRRGSEPQRDDGHGGCQTRGTGHARRDQEDRG